MKNEIGRLDVAEYQRKRCTWSLGKKDGDPHIHTKVEERKKIFRDAIEAMCHSPMIKLNTIPKEEGIKCEILAKCEFFLPGGSLKDRMAKRLIEDAEKVGKIKPGITTLIEASSGNTGIGLALAGAIKGYKVIITLPEKVSKEKCDLIKSLGATVVCTPDDVDFADPNSHFGTARKLNKQIPDSIILDQFTNSSNPLVHYDETAEEIWEQCNGKIDYIVIGAGTGGTITGIGRKFKEKDSSIKVIGVDPVGSLLAYPECLNKEGPKPFKVEGIGYGFTPRVCDIKPPTVDKWIKVNDEDSFKMARRLIKSEDLLVGGTPGSVMTAAIQIARDLPADKRMVVVLADCSRNYMTKFMNDDWMLENGYMKQQLYDEKYFKKDNQYYNGHNGTISDINLNKVPYATMSSTVEDIVDLMNQHKIECLPVVDQDNSLNGIITLRTITSLLTNYKLKWDDTIKRGVNTQYSKVKSTDSIKYLSKGFTRNQFIVVEDIEGQYKICQHQNLLEHYKKQLT